VKNFKEPGSMFEKTLSFYILLKINEAIIRNAFSQKHALTRSLNTPQKQQPFLAFQRLNTKRFSRAYISRYGGFSRYCARLFFSVNLWYTLYIVLSGMIDFEEYKHNT
jgi:hypothetical protein